MDWIQTDKGKIQLTNQHVMMFYMREKCKNCLISKYSILVIQFKMKIIKYACITYHLLVDIRYQSVHQANKKYNQNRVTQTNVKTVLVLNKWKTLKFFNGIKSYKTVVHSKFTGLQTLVLKAATCRTHCKYIRKVSESKQWSVVLVCWTQHVLSYWHCTSASN